jgi:predicted dehydrogenase/NADPH:quinone reductase-like Zn-dependent oxidoreductase
MPVSVSIRIPILSEYRRPLMKQVLQDLRAGRTEVADVPCPAAGHGQLLIRSTRTLVSAGTERMLLEFGKAGWIEKARQQPDKVRAAFDKIKTDGLIPTLEAVSNKLEQPLPMGYCNVGEVVALGAGVQGFNVGDRVASNGRHAEIVAVSANLCGRVPAGVTDDAAAFTVLGAIALQGIRLAQPTLGEAVAVTGLGLIGLLTVQLLRANGCRVLAIDFDARRLDLAHRFGADVVDLAAGEDPVVAGQRFSRGRGMDAVLITAATSSHEPVQQAARMSRKRGRLVLVGVAGLELSRADFYEKELSFQVSCSYGPGRYDPVYEEKGFDYPVGFVRWTEQRNFEAVLDMLEGERLSVQPLITHRFPISQAAVAYEVVGGSEPSLGILLEYPGSAKAVLATRSVHVAKSAHAAPSQPGEKPTVGLIGAGNYACAVLAPEFRATGARLRSVVSASGVSGLHAARKFGFEQATTDAEVVVGDPEVNVVVIATRHDSHASYVLQARARGKHVFVEKPLCLTLTQLDEIASAYSTDSPLLMVGFNRRFAPHVVRMKRLLAATPSPKAFVVTVNAGAVPSTHWTQDASVGGGRLVGENCHFIDLLRGLAGHPIIGHRTQAMGAAKDSATITLSFADGSIGTIHYLANGSKAFPKERVEVFVAGRVLQLDNFRVLRGFGWPGFRKMRLWRQDKGQRACVQAFVEAVRGGPSPIPLGEILEVTRVSIESAQATQ